MLLQNPNEDKLYASLDEAGRGSFAGAVVAACVIWKPGPRDHLINDSKKLSSKMREELAEYIKENAIDYSIQFIDPKEIDRMNILNATMQAMHKCLDQLTVNIDHILVDGNFFKKYKDITYDCIIAGDAKYVSIAAASILAKEARDNYMKQMAFVYPKYHWEKNMGYGTKEHRDALLAHGYCPLHRLSFIKNWIPYNNPQ